MRTPEQMAAQDAMRAVAPGYRVIPDAEGWPMVPGRRHGRTDDGTGHGRDRLDWVGGDEPLACVVAARHRVGYKVKALLAIPGVRRHQVGDTEARLLVSAAAVPAVLAVIRGQRQRVGHRGGRLFGSGTDPEGLQRPTKAPRSPKPGTDMSSGSDGQETASGGQP